MDEVSFVTYNAKDYERILPGEPSYETEERRYRLFEEMIRTMLSTTVNTTPDASPPAVIAVQELSANKPERPAGHVLAGLAEAVGLDCMVRKSRGPGDPGIYAAQTGGVSNHAVGLMWSKDFRPLEDSWIGANEGFWHSIAAVALDVGAHKPVLHASAHLPPFRGSHLRAGEAEGGARILIDEQTITPYVILGLDQNSMSLDPVYDQMPDLPHYPPKEIARRRINIRKADAAYTEGGLIDAVYRLDKGRYLAQGRDRDDQGRLLSDLRAIPTTGHYTVPEFKMSNYGARRIDVVRASMAMLPALADHKVPSDIPGIKQASDHLPQIVTYNSLCLVGAS